MPIIVLEGVDGGGKSTLAEAICTHYEREGLGSADVVHLGAPKGPDTALNEALEPLTMNYVERDDLLVLDRAHWGSPVYAPVYRPDTNLDGYGDITRAGWRYAELVYAAHGACTFLTTVDPDVARARCTVRGEDYINLDHIPKLIERYESLYDESLTGTVKFELSVPEDTARAAVTAINIAISANTRVRRVVRTWPHYVGATSVKRLFITSADRQERLDILADLETDAWKNFGFMSSLTASESIESFVEFYQPHDIIATDTQH